MKELKTKLPVYGLDGKVVDNIQLDKDLFDGTVNEQLLYEAIKMYEANKRQGTAKAKNRGDVAGGGVKPWRQKGTGRARVGSTRNPIWRHGGVVFPPKPRDLSYSMPKKALRGALLSSLNARLLENMIKPIVKIEVKKAKTKEFKEIMDKLKIDKKAIVIVLDASTDVKRSSRNLKGVSIKESKNINARDILLNDYIIIEKDALENLSERLK